MPAREYPFIEIAVHPSVRERFAEGQALAVFSPGIDYVYWANGTAARQFGYETIYAFLEDEAFEETVLARQIAAAAHQLNAVRSRQNLVLRLGTGFRRVATPCTIEQIDLPDGEPALLLALPVDPRLKDSIARARTMIDGFGDIEAGPGASLMAAPMATHVAVLDGDANSLAQSLSFDGLGIDAAALEQLVEEAGRGSSRLAKRTISTSRGLLPAAVARLADDPALHLIFVVEPEPAEAPAAEGMADQGTDRVADEAARPSEPDDTAAQQVPTPPADAPIGAPIATPGFQFNPAGRPVRFVWKIDTEGRFSEISPEFADAVGPNAADVIGRTFGELAQVFNLDPDHIITDLLRRRDTWSGKTVLWPVQGTGLAVPVDLAALPTYSRERQFDGFRGFGIIRVADAAADPERLGLALDPGNHLEQALEPAAEEHRDRLGAEEPDDGTPEPADATAVVTPPTPSNDDNAPADHQVPETEREAEMVAEPATPTPSDPFRGEVPALRIVETPARRHSDKVIDLQQRRSRGREGLSTIDQAIFHQIGEELGRRLAGDAASAPAQKETPAETGPETGDREATSSPAKAEARDHRAAPDAEHVPAVMLARPPLPAPAKLADQPDDAKSEALEPATAAAGLTGPAEDATAAELDTQRATGDAPAQPLPAAEPVAAVFLPMRHTVPEPASEAEEAAPRPLEEQHPAADTPQREDERPAFAAAAPAAPAIDQPASAPDAAPPVAARAVLTKGLVDNMPLPLLVHRGDVLLHANPELLEFTGYPTREALEEASALGVLFVANDNPLAGVRQAIDATAEVGGRGMLTLMRADGTHVAVRARLQSIGWGDGHALLLALAPVSQRLQAEVEMRELRSILETATDGVVILDEDGTIRSMNGSASALFDYDVAETRGKPFAMLFAHESQRAVIDYVLSLTDNGVASVLNDGREVIGREASGGFIPLFMTIGRLKGSNGYCAVMRDITHWKRTEDELRNAKRAAETANAHKSDFLASVSHEIRTPLNAIIGFAEMMATERFGAIGSPRYLEYAHDIGRSGRHVLDIVNDLLDISKIEAGEQEMDFVAVALNETLAETVSLLQPQANSQRVIIRTSLSTTLPEIVADQRSIKQIALNLLSNAIRFTPAGGQIVVSTAYDQAGRVVMRVRDTGIGMTRSELDQAMKPFRQVTTGASRPRGDGTGLGLPLTKAMVEANRAHFSIESTPGEGTLVQIAFPSQRVLAD